MYERLQAAFMGVRHFDAREPTGATPLVEKPHGENRWVNSVNLSTTQGMIRVIPYIFIIDQLQEPPETKSDLLTYEIFAHGLKHVTRKEYTVLTQEDVAIITRQPIQNVASQIATIYSPQCDSLLEEIDSITTQGITVENYIKTLRALKINDNHLPDKSIGLIVKTNLDVIKDLTKPSQYEEPESYLQNPNRYPNRTRKPYTIAQIVQRDKDVKQLVEIGIDNVSSGILLGVSRHDVARSVWRLRQQGGLPPFEQPPKKVKKNRKKPSVTEQRKKEREINKLCVQALLEQNVSHADIAELLFISPFVEKELAQEVRKEKGVQRKRLPTAELSILDDQVEPFAKQGLTRAEIAKILRKSKGQIKHSMERLRAARRLS